MSRSQSANPKRARSDVAGKKREILDAAARHFLTHGYQGASINELARQSRISKESIYRYFPSKAKLFEAVIDQEMANYTGRLQQAHLDDESIGLRDALVVTAEIMLENLLSDRSLALNRLIVQETVSSPDVGRHFYRYGPRQTIQRIEKLFKRHQRRTDFDPKTLSTDFRAMVLHAHALERRCGLRAAPSRSQVRKLARATVDRFLKAFFHAETR